MGWEGYIFAGLAASVGSAATFALWAVHALTKWREEAKHPRPADGELMEFRAWKRVRSETGGDKFLYRDIVHRWNTLERERNEARKDAKKATYKIRRLEQKVADLAAEQCESPLIRVVARRQRTA